MCAGVAGERRNAVRHAWLAICVVVSVALVVMEGVWEENREADAALRDDERARAGLATLVATGVAARLDAVRADLRMRMATRVGDTPSADFHVVPGDAPRPSPPPGHVLVSVPAPDGRRGDLVLAASRLLGDAGPRGVVDLTLVRPPGDARFHSTAGGLFASEALDRALSGASARGQAATRLTREESAALRLPPCMAIAGAAWAQAGELGRWGVVVVGSAAPARDRHARARWRVALGVILSGGLVLAFGAYALRAQRKEMEMSRELSVAALGQQRDERLEREGRAAAMLALAVGVAHEVSTPLSVIQGRAEQMLDRADDARDVRAARGILEQTARIEGVIRGFLVLARSDAPTLERLAPVDVVRGAAELVAHRFAKEGVRLTVEPCGAAPPVRGDRSLLEHALANLLLNACDASERGDSVRLSARHDPDVGEVVFAVDDDGAGVSPDLAARVSDAFFHVGAPDRGAGMGLTIAREIARIHRGALALAPRRARGTHAAVRLPTAHGADDVTP